MTWNETTVHVFAWNLIWSRKKSKIQVCLKVRRARGENDLWVKTDVLVFTNYTFVPRQTERVSYGWCRVLEYMLYFSLALWLKIVYLRFFGKECVGFYNTIRFSLGINTMLKFSGNETFQKKAIYPLFII